VPIHFVAALVAALLLLQPLAQRLHQLFEPAQRSRSPCPLPRGSGASRPAFSSQSFGISVASSTSSAADLPPALPNDVGKGLVEPVQMAFILHHRRTRQVVEPVDIIGHQTRPDAFQERQVLAQAETGMRARRRVSKNGRNMHARVGQSGARGNGKRRADEGRKSRLFRSRKAGFSAALRSAQGPSASQTCPEGTR
jgi:hypothetical protein